MLHRWIEPVKSLLAQDGPLDVWHRGHEWGLSNKVCDERVITLSKKGAESYLNTSKKGWSEETIIQSLTIDTTSMGS